jgi:hypothetical protein
MSDAYWQKLVRPAMEKSMSTSRKEHDEGTGTMTPNLNPREDCEFVAYLRLGGVNYRMRAFADMRRPTEPRWRLRFVPLRDSPAPEEQ